MVHHLTAAGCRLPYGIM